MKKSENNLTSFSDHIEKQYGKKGTTTRDAFERSLEGFKVSVLIYSLRTEEGITQEELANRCGTTKAYISRIENDASDIRLSTLLRIVEQGFGKQLQMTVV